MVSNDFPADFTHNLIFGVVKHDFTHNLTSGSSSTDPRPHISQFCLFWHVFDYFLAIFEEKSPFFFTKLEFVLNFLTFSLTTGSRRGIGSLDYFRYFASGDLYFFCCARTPLAFISIVRLFLSRARLFLCKCFATVVSIKIMLPRQRVYDIQRKKV